MEVQDMTRDQLREKVSRLRRRVSELEAAESERGQAPAGSGSRQPDDKEAERSLHELLDSLPEAICEIDLEGRVTYSNRKALSVYGNTFEEAIGMNAAEGFVPEDHDRLKKNVEKILKGEDIGWMEYTALTKDGGTFPIMTHSSPIVRDGEIVGLRGILIDITERRQVEHMLRESEQRFRTIFNNATDGILLADVETRKFYMGNKAICQMLGYTQGEIENLRVTDIHPEKGMDQTFGEFEKQASGQTTRAKDIPMKRKDGSVFYADINSSLVALTGKTYLAGFFRDTSERKRAEEALQVSEQKYRALVENTNDIAYSMNVEGALTYLAPQVRRYGIEPEEALGAGFWEFIHPEDREKLAGDLQRTLATGEEFPSEFRLIDREGQIHWLEDHGKVLRDRFGRITGISGMLRDITKRKETENALRESEEKWRSLVENAPNIIIIVDRDATIQFVNRTVSGRAVEEAIGTKVYDYAPAEYHNAIGESIEQVFQTGRTGRYETKGEGPEGSTSWYETQVGPIKSDGQVVAVTLINTDITERKETENALRESEEKYRLLAESITDVIWTMDLDLRFTYISPSVKQLRGYSVEESISQAMEETLTPSSVELARSVFAEEMAIERTGKGAPDRSRTIELEQTRKDGSTVCTEVKMSFLRDEEGRPVGILGVTRDISERKKAEEALKKSEEKWRSLVENAPNIIMIVDRDGTIQFINHTVPGLTVEETVGANQYDYIEPEHRDIVRDVIEKVFQTGQGGKYQIRGAGPDGTISWYETHVGPVKSEGQVAAVTLITSDITKRKEAEEALKESETRYRLLAENATDVIWTMDMNLQYTYISPSVTRSEGYTVEEAMSRSLDEVLTPSSLEAAKRIFEEEIAIERSKEKDLHRSRTLELELIRKDGSTFWAELKTSFLRDSNGAPVSILGVTRDITERKQFGRRLAEAQEEERHRLSSQLHDDLGQILTVAKIRIDRLRDARFNDMVALTRELSEVCSLLDDALEETRDLSRSLRPPLLDQLGLTATLRSLAAQFKSNTGTPVHIQAEEIRDQLPKHVETLIYRMAQEGLTNAAKHAGASEVRVSLTVTDEHVELTIVDNGKGFNVREAERRTDCLGIRSMQSRVTDSGGIFHLTSEISKGTTVYVKVPLSQQSG